MSGTRGMDNIPVVCSVAAYRRLHPQRMTANAPNQVRLLPVFSVQRQDDGPGARPNRLFYVVRDEENREYPASINYVVHPDGVVRAAPLLSDIPPCVPQPPAEPSTSTTPVPPNETKHKSWCTSRCITQKAPLEVYRAFSEAKKRRIKQRRKLEKAMTHSQVMRSLQEKKERLLAAVKKGKLELEYLSLQVHGMETSGYPSTFGPIVRLKKQRLKDKLSQLKVVFEQYKNEMTEFQNLKNKFRRSRKLNINKFIRAALTD